MTKTFKTVSLAVLVLMGAFAFGQTSLTQTTLAAAITVGTSGAASGITGSYTTQISLASATGVQTAFNGQPITFVYVDQELFGILTLAPGQTTIWNALRAQSGTKASAHASGVMALVETVSPQFGGFSGSGGFQGTDPAINGNCTAANTNVTPWVNIITGAQWVCSTITNTWAPSWNNPLSNPASWIQAATIASVAGSTPVAGPYFNISGTNAITGFTIPVGFDTTKGGCFTANPTGIWTWTAAGNIATAGTVTAATTPVTFCWNVVSQKWVPSRLA